MRPFMIGALLAVSCLLGLVAPSAPTASAQRSDAEQTYLDQSLLLLTMSARSTQDISELFGNPRIGDPDWEDELVGVTFVWHAIRVAHDDLTPPSRLREIHRTIGDAFALTDSAGEDYRLSLRTYDASLVAAGTDKINQATILFDEANEQIEDLMD